MLTAYNGTAITYDAIGNPLKWRNAVGLTWEGRQLQRTNLAANAFVDYTYNSSGIRTSKRYVNSAAYMSETRNYVLDGTRIIQEDITISTITSLTNATLYYLYDASGSVQGFIYNNAYYYFQKNLQGDVVRILNSSGTVVVEYTYDAWGNVLTTTGSMATTLGRYNPFRYRSYYYDVETGFYYLQSRYYDPTVGRFLNADKYASTGIGIVGCNMFAYCNNIPTSYSDYNGSTPAAAAAVEVISVFLTVVVVLVFIDYELATEIVVGAVDLVDSLVDAVSGAFTTSEASVAAPTVSVGTSSVCSSNDEAEQIIETVLIEKLTNYEGPDKSPHSHHIVAQTAARAKPARDILEIVFPNVGTSHALNLIVVKQPVHQRLHTHAYYDYVNAVIYEAYISAGIDKEKQRENVKEALIQLQFFIGTLNKLIP